MGGKREDFCFAFGEHDTYTILDVPSNADMAAFAATISAIGSGGDRDRRPPYHRGN
jgi:uncharacterized protein with GYD domain